MLCAVAETGIFERLNGWIDELARRWERYLSNDPRVPVPPERERAALERRLKELSRSEAGGAVERFRLDQLLQRFAVYNSLWQRRLQERETALARGPGQSVRPVKAPANADEATSVGGVEREAYRQLHRRYVELAGARGQRGPASYEQFFAALEKERRRLEADGAVVEGFEVVDEVAGVRLRARLRSRRQE
jgi:hypothetical protein